MLVLHLQGLIYDKLIQWCLKFLSSFILLLNMEVNYLDSKGCYRLVDNTIALHFGYMFDCRI